MRLEVNGQIIESEDSTEVIAAAIRIFGPAPDFEIIRTWAESQVNAWADQEVMKLKILEPELFYVAMISNIAFRLLEWVQLGRPETVDPTRFIVTISEAQAYSETSQPGMTPADLLRLQEQRWTAMQQGFAVVVYKRRRALEKIKLAASVEEVASALNEL